jgi:putative SbcD/Mre11-related phosphoesterase
MEIFHMDLEFITDHPAIFIKKERLIAVGDLHIGRDLVLGKSGVHMPNATERLIQSILLLSRERKATGIVLMGDVKESLAYPSREEYEELSRFFYELRKLQITITKGNHDPRIEEIVKRLDASVSVVKELLLEDVALMHGHAMPSGEAMMKKYLVTAHSHPAIMMNGTYEKAWAVAGIGKNARKFYEKYNRRIKLVITPAFNELITGSDLSTGAKFAPLLRNNIFDLKKAKIYSLAKKPLGKVEDYTEIKSDWA